MRKHSGIIISVLLGIIVALGTALADVTRLYLDSPTPAVLQSAADNAEALYVAWVGGVLERAPLVGACEHHRQLTRYQAAEIMTRWLERTQALSQAIGGDGDTTKLSALVERLYRSGKAGRVNPSGSCAALRLELQGA